MSRMALICNRGKSAMYKLLAYASALAASIMSVPATAGIVTVNVTGSFTSTSAFKFQPTPTRIDEPFTAYIRFDTNTLQNAGVDHYTDVADYGWKMHSVYPSYSGQFNIPSSPGTIAVSGNTYQITGCYGVFTPCLTFDLNLNGVADVFFRGDGKELASGSTVTLSSIPDRVFSGRIDTLSYTISGAVPPLSLASGVPEPSVWAMMVLGLGMIGAALRFRPTYRSASA